MKKILLLALISSNFIFSQSFVPNAPELNLKSYILIDPNTNTVIAEANSEGQIEPASMTKVMTAYVVADQIKNGLISLEDKVLISEKAWKMGGSKMFIEVGKKVSVLDLLKGIMIQSGNDASVAIAEYVGGTEDGFVDLMNAYAGAIGMNNSYFANSTGLPSEGHLTSASDLATLTSKFITNFPDIYSLFKEKEFEYGGISGNK
jgi:D-alanyl-D-alanine carboxypeptidase (penicillin-binding protein 5/6)